MIKLNGKPINVTIFPDKTSQVWQLDDNELNTALAFRIDWKFESESEVMHLVQLKMLLDTYDRQSFLFIDFLPYARQDKAISNKSTFALAALDKVISALNFKQITFTDPHSSPGRYNWGGDTVIKIQHTDVEFRKVYDLVGANIVGYPDYGAESRYSESDTVITASKIRDQLTGEIYLEVDKNIDINDKVVITRDDICDGGRTFIEFTKELLNNGAKEVHLFVSHGIFSKGLKPLKDAGIGRIFTKEGEWFEDREGNLSYVPFSN